MQDNRLHPQPALLRIFFRFLYHQLAFVYDLVAAVVSLGHWKEWILEVVPFIQGRRTLEIGHGSGHLNRFLLDRGLEAVAIDESAPMGRLARKKIVTGAFESLDRNLNKNLSRTDYAQINLTRGLAQGLPFRDGAFDSIIATFPAEYISDRATLSEVYRCLSDGGRFIVLPVAMPSNRILLWLFKVTGQAPADALEVIREKLEEPFIQAGLDVATQLVEKSSGTLVIIIATRKEI